MSEKGAKIVDSRAEVFAADCVLAVRALGANPDRWALADLELMRAGQTLIAMADPLGRPAEAEKLAERGVTLFALELMPRITRAQSMDVLSSQATVAGYRAVLLAAMTLPKMFPMMTTAAGTLTPAKVFIVGAGVAGLQAIASARRLGAVTQRLRRAAGGQRNRCKAWEPGSSNSNWPPPTRKPKGAMPRRWTKIFIAGSAK